MAIEEACGTTYLPKSATEGKNNSASEGGQKARERERTSAPKEGGMEGVRRKLVPLRRKTAQRRKETAMTRNVKRCPRASAGRPATRTRSFPTLLVTKMKK